MALQRDFAGGFVIVEVSTIESKVTKERVDKDLETSLQPVPHRPILLVRILGTALGIDTALAQILQHYRERRQHIVAGTDAGAQHDGRIQALDVALHHWTEYTGVDHLHIAARKWFGPHRQWNTVLCTEVSADHEVVDLAAGPSHSALLIAHGHHLCLVELVWHDQST